MIHVYDIYHIIMISKQYREEEETERERERVAERAKK